MPRVPGHLFNKRHRKEVSRKEVGRVRIRVTWVRERNEGCGSRRTEGVAESRGVVGDEGVFQL